MFTSSESERESDILRHESFNSATHLGKSHQSKQECIPIGCVPSAAVAVSWRGGGGLPVGASTQGFLLRGVSAQGVCLPRGVCLWGCLPWGGGCLPNIKWQWIQYSTIKYLVWFWDRLRNCMVYTGHKRPRTHWPKSHAKARTAFCYVFRFHRRATLSIVSRMHSSVGDVVVAIEIAIAWSERTLRLGRVVHQNQTCIQ